MILGVNSGYDLAVMCRSPVEGTVVSARSDLLALGRTFINE